MGHEKWCNLCMGCPDNMIYDDMSGDDSSSVACCAVVGGQLVPVVRRKIKPEDKCRDTLCPRRKAENKRAQRAKREVAKAGA